MWRRVAVHLALWTVALSQPLLGLYGDNLAVFTSARVDGSTVVSFALVVLVVPSLAVSLIDVSAGFLAPRASVAVHHGLVFTGVWASVSVAARSVSVGSWYADVLLSATIAVALTLLYARREVVRTWSRWMSALVPVVAAAFVASAWSVIVPSGPEGVAAAQTDDVDVVWIQLDEAPVFPLLRTDGTINDRRFPGFAALASVSTWYRDAVSVSQRTSVAVPSMLTGRAPDYSLQPVLAHHPRNILTLVRDSMELDVVEEATRLCVGGWCDRGVPDPIPRATFSSLVRDAFVVAGHMMFPEGLRSRLPAIDEGWGGFGGDSPVVADRVATAFEHGRGQGGDRLNAYLSGHESRLEHLATVAERQQQSTRPTFRFAHVLLPHRPWLLAPDQRIATRTDSDYRPGTLDDKRRDAYQSLLNQYIAVDAEIGRLVERLRESPRWSKTMLIVTADHGITFIPGESARDEINPDNPASLDDIFRVPLFVKMPGQTSAIVDDCPVTVLDLVPTVAARLGVEPDWPLVGVDLARRCSGQPDREITWIKGSTTARFGVDALIERVEFYDSWIDSEGDVDDIARTGPYGALVGTVVPAEAPTENVVKWTLSNAESFDRVSDGRFGSVPTRATGLITVRRDFADDEEILIAVNDRFVGVVREAAGLGAWRTTLYSSSLLSRLITAGENKVSLWTVRGGAGAPRFARLGAVSR